MKNNYVRWAVWGAVLGLINVFKKYHDDEKLNIHHTPLEWLMIIAAYIGVFMLLMLIITAIMKKLRKDDGTGAV